MGLFGGFATTVGMIFRFVLGIPLGMTFVGVPFGMFSGLTEKLADLDGFAATIGGILTGFAIDGDREVFGSKADLIEGLAAAAASNGSFTVVGRDGDFVGNVGSFLPGLVRIFGFALS